MSNLGFNMTGKTLEILFYGEIGDDWDGITAKQFAAELKPHGNATEILLRMNSVGGSVFDGAAIYNILNRHKARVLVDIDGAALSAASLVAMAGDTIRIAENAMMMIHNPWMLTIGDDQEHERSRSLLKSMANQYADTYAKRTGGNIDDITAMMADETWMTGGEAVDAGFADEITESKRAAATVRVPQKWYKKTPAALLAERPLVSDYKDRLQQMVSRKVANA